VFTLHHNFHGVLSCPVGGDESFRVLTVHPARGNLVSASADCDVQCHASIGESFQLARSCQDGRHKRIQFQPFIGKFEAEERTMEQSHETAQPPQHVGRIDLCRIGISCVERIILIIGGKQRSRADVASQGVHQSRFVSRFGGSLAPI